VTSPAPSRERPLAEPEDRELRTDTERAASVPETARDSRPETERRDTCEREVDREVWEDAEERAEGTLPPRAPATPDGWEAPDGCAPDDGAEPAGDRTTATTGASPQVSQ
jgi:hypothetical protein